ncbi:Pycsar system effector family protein [Raineyella fluvialis]|uniref:Pycsar effector protein domain-containing protein n=1 Tax=Raineyella fluvialis TaxID=2662261 RepID=A0A5Q2FE90_9ACTN|nr:Pycsar system effector family protein [Raineyella fluvialis]QGF23784.1 hypothetical protein Rai3103_08975 [Raineyella fluvialis]
MNEWVKHAEAKLAVVLAFIGVLAAALIALAIEAEDPSCLILGLEGVAGLSVLAASTCAALGVLPRYQHQADLSQANPLYYSDIAHHFAGRESEYVENLSSTLADSDALVKQLARQAFANSSVATRKYFWANRAIWSGMVALGFTLALGAGVVMTR